MSPMTPMDCAVPALFISPDSLPRLGAPSNATCDYLGKFADAIEGKDILCIGYDEAQIDEWVSKFKPRSITCLTFWADHTDGAVTKYPLIVGDITQRTAFPDNRFDAVVSLSTLEHLGDLEAGLVEMKRLTRSGGNVLAMFGPAWSSAYGHHIYERAGDAFLDFSKWQLPAFLHLLCSPEQIRSFYGDDADAALHWFYEAPHINRLMYDDYVRLFFKHFQVQTIEHMTLDVPAEIISLLRRKYAPYADFSTYGGSYRLKVIK